MRHAIKAGLHPPIGASPGELRLWLKLNGMMPGANKSAGQSKSALNKVGQQVGRRSTASTRRLPPLSRGPAERREPLAPAVAPSNLQNVARSAGLKGGMHAKPHYAAHERERLPSHLPEAPLARPRGVEVKPAAAEALAPAALAPFAELEVEVDRPYDDEDEAHPVVSSPPKMVEEVEPAAEEALAEDAEEDEAVVDVTEASMASVHEAPISSSAAEEPAAEEPAAEKASSTQPPVAEDDYGAEEDFEAESIEIE